MSNFNKFSKNISASVPTGPVKEISPLPTTPTPSPKPEEPLPSNPPKDSDVA